MYKIEERYVIVTDDWSRCYDGNKVRLSIRMVYPDKCNSRKCKIRPYAMVKVEYEWTQNGGEIINAYSDETDELYKDKAALTYNAWKRDIFDCVPDGVNRQWFLENGFVNG